MNKINKLLNDDGLALIHTIGSIKQPRDPQPWVTKYIFPGGFLPSLKSLPFAMTLYIVTLLTKTS